MNYRTPLTEADLHAYVDGDLSPSRQKEVEAYLDAHPEAAAEVEDYRRMNAALHQLYDPVLDEPLPAQLAVRPARARLWRAAAAVAWMSLGGLIGWSLQPDMLVRLAGEPGHRDHALPDLVQPAAFAHVVYTPEVRHPVEVPATDEQHLVDWLSNRLHSDIRAPDLSGQGYRLVGGRLLPSTDRMAAQFMYERADGLRVTLYVRRGAWENTSTAFRFDRTGGLGVFYWIDGPLGYALTGNLECPDLLALSEAVHRQLR